MSDAVTGNAPARLGDTAALHRLDDETLIRECARRRMAMAAAEIERLCRAGDRLQRAPTMPDTAILAMGAVCWLRLEPVPTIDEMADAMGVWPNAVYERRRRLARDGWARQPYLRFRQMRVRALPRWAGGRVGDLVRCPGPVALRDVVAAVERTDA